MLKEFFAQVAFDNERLFNFFRDVASNQPGNGNRSSTESNQTFAKKFTSGVTKVGKLFLADIDSDSVENDDLNQGMVSVITVILFYICVSRSHFGHESKSLFVRNEQYCQ